MSKNTKYLNYFTPFFSATSSQIFLLKRYSRFRVVNADQKSFQNCYPFIYYLDHAKTYYEQASAAPLTIKPILIFYGLVQLLKACLLTIDPHYPESTSLLAHGVTTRKRKKQQYEFLKDEVKVQKNGLLPYLAEQLFQIKHLEGEKFTMESLLNEIPEVQTSSLHYSKKNFEELTPTDEGYILPISILDQYQMTSHRFFEFIQSKCKQVHSLQEHKNNLLLTFEKSLNFNSNSPIRYHEGVDRFMLSLNRNSNSYLLPEILSHYLILYNLSMIARYETEWWLELFKTTPNDDYPLIVQFLKSTQYKTLFLISNWLINEK